MKMLIEKETLNYNILYEEIYDSIVRRAFLCYFLKNIRMLEWP